MCRKKRFKGLMLIFLGLGMVIQFMMPGWGFLLAIAMIIIGLWYAFAW